MPVKAGYDVLAERFRQIQEYGVGFERHDSGHSQGGLVDLAIYFAGDESVRAALETAGIRPKAAYGEPFDPRERRTNLVRAAAFLIAEIERIDRAADRGLD